MNFLNPLLVKWNIMFLFIVLLITYINNCNNNKIKFSRIKICLPNKQWSRPFRRNVINPLNDSIKKINVMENKCKVTYTQVLFSNSTALRAVSKCASCLSFSISYWTAVSHPTVGNKKCILFKLYLIQIKLYKLYYVQLKHSLSIIKVFSSF